VRNKWLSTTIWSGTGTCCGQDIGADSFSAVNMVFREVWDSVEEEGRVPLHGVDRQLMVQLPPLLSAWRGQMPDSLSAGLLYDVTKGCLKKKPNRSNFVFLISRAQVIRSSKCWCLPPIIRGVLWGVDTNILKIQKLGLEI
jgi:hypothetical protein